MYLNNFCVFVENIVIRYDRSSIWNFTFGPGKSPPSKIVEIFMLFFIFKRFLSKRSISPGPEVAFHVPLIGL
jgi:hypothetical protein